MSFESVSREYGFPPKSVHMGACFPHTTQRGLMRWCSWSLHACMVPHVQSGLRSFARCRPMWSVRVLSRVWTGVHYVLFIVRHTQHETPKSELCKTSNITRWQVFGGAIKCAVRTRGKRCTTVCVWTDYHGWQPFLDHLDGFRWFTHFSVMNVKIT